MMDAPSSTSARSPSELEIAFVAREAWAFEAAYHAFKRMLYGAALSVLHDASEAEDCVHDVLMRLWQRGNAYTPARGRLEAFLSVCVRNEALSRVRKRSTRQRIEHGKLAVDEAQPGGDESIVERMRVAQALQRLGERQREAIQLAYFEGFTYEEIARKMGEPLGTIKSRLSNALRILRRSLANGEER
jgi:RNA polymerase sigma-70 factor (ECF subfamily)